jgi:sugar transferase (PEP-CTERM/EpsH1 system associated)
MTSRDTRPLVAHVVYRFGVGGLENGVVNLINRASGFRHMVVALTQVDPEFARRIARSDVSFVEFHKPPGSGLKLYRRFLALFEAHRPAVVHTRNMGTLDALIPAWRANVPVRVHGEHGWDAGDEEGRSRRNRMVRRVYRPLVHHYVALSKPIARYLTEAIGVRRDRVEEICNGVDVERFRPAGTERPPIPGCPFTQPDHWLVGTVGRMQSVKDQPNLARAFSILVNENPEARRRARLVIAGDGPLRRECEAILDESGARDLAWFAGEREDVPDFLRGLDCFALPSRTEGISNTILEASACGLPIVATRVGGTPDIVEEGANALLISPSRPRELAAAIGRYFSHPDLARRHGERSRTTAVQRFSLERMVAGYTELYLRLLRARTATASGSVAHERS